MKSHWFVGNGFTSAGPMVTVSAPNWKYIWLFPWYFRLRVLALPPASPAVAPAFKIQSRGPMFAGTGATCLNQIVATKLVMTPLFPRAARAGSFMSAATTAFPLLFDG